MRALSFVLSLLLLAVPTLAATTPQKTTPLESKVESKQLVARLLREGKIMRARDAKRGMRGYALSVFQGTKIERFGIEVLGTLERVQSGGDLVMIRVLDGPVVQRQSGIIQGMSGSPVYINGKLLGAIAIGFGFPKEPIGGVTPITQMIEGALPDAAPPRPNPERAVPPSKIAASVFRARAPIRVAGRDINRVEVTRNPRLAALDGATLRMRPCTNYILLSGVSPSRFGVWQKLFAPYDVTPVLGGGAMGNSQVFGPSSRKSGVQTALVPGAGIGVQLASGDIDISGVGTVTYRIGQRVLAFGHPMFGLGAVSMPMTTAYVHDIFPSYETSFKLASPMAPVGELEQDTAFAVAGTVGRKAQTIPMTVHVRDDLKHIDRTFHVGLIQDPLFTPQLAIAVAAEAVQGELGLASGKTVLSSLRLKLRGLPEIVRSNVAYSDDPVFGAALAPFAEALGLSQQNPFGKGALQSISIDARVVPGRKTAVIRRLLADHNRVKAGDTVTLSVALAPFNAPDALVTKSFRIQVPADAPDGVLRVAVSPADSFWSARTRVGGAPPHPGNLRELLTAYARIGRSDDLLLQVSTPRRFLLVDRKRVDNPPASWNRLVGGAASSSIGAYNETLEQHQPTEFVLDGLETLNLVVESTRRSSREAPDAAPTASASASDVPSITTPAITPAPIPNDVAVWFGAASSAPRPLFGSAGADALRLQTIPRVKGRKIERASVAASSATPTPTPTPTATPSPDASAATIARPAGKWVQDSASDFARGEFSGSVARADGTLVPGPTAKLLASTPEAVAWSVAGAPDGSVYIGTGNNARLFRVKNGVSKVIYEGPEVAVSALASDGAGNVYAGVSPGGRVLRFAPNGTYTVVLQTGEQFIGALAFDDKGALIVGTGGARGAIYRVEDPRSASEYAALRSGPVKSFVTTAKHIRSLAFSNGAIYAGTADDAMLLRIGADGKVETLYEAREGAVSSLPLPEGTTANMTTTPSPDSFAAQNAAQNAAIMAAMGVPDMGAGAKSGEITGVAPVGDAVYFSSLLSGTVSRWTRARGVEEAAKTPARAIYSLRADANGALYAGTGEGGELFRLAPQGDGTFDVARVLDARQGQIPALDVLADGRVLAATANNAALWQLAPASDAGQYTSNVFDAGATVRWGAVRALGSDFAIETRSGETADPDATWSAFAPLSTAYKVVSPPARYLQYRVKIAAATGRVERVETFFRAPNHPPKLTWTLPVGGEYLSGKKTLTWTGADPDGDALRYSLDIQTAKGWVPVELSAPTTASFELDTAKYPDGPTRLRLRGSDATRNPDDPRETTLVSTTFTLDNTPPTLSGLEVRKYGAGEKYGAGWELRAQGSDATSPLAGAEWRVVNSPAKPAKTPTPTPTTAAAPDKEAPVWVALGTGDGLFDSNHEEIIGVLDPALSPSPLASGTKIEVRLRDAADNATTRTVTLP